MFKDDVNGFSFTSVICFMASDSLQISHNFHFYILAKHSCALQRHNTENLKQIVPEKELRGLSPNFHIHVSVGDLYILTNGSAYSAARK